MPQFLLFTTVGETRNRCRGAPTLNVLAFRHIGSVLRLLELYGGTLYSHNLSVDRGNEITGIDTNSQRGKHQKGRNFILMCFML